MQEPKKYPKVHICHPSARGEYTRSFYIGMMMTARLYPGEFVLKFSEGLAIEWARNVLVREFLDSDSEYLFFVDTDTGIPLYTLQQLVDDDKDIVSGLYFGRKPPFQPIIKKLEKVNDTVSAYRPILEYPEGLIEVDGCGAGCLLIHRRVFEAMPEPWFFAPLKDMSEDIYFFEHAKKEGFKIWVDTRVKCAHDTTLAVTEELYKGNL